MLEVMLGGAISLNASDIHLEPEDKMVRMRYRLDGMLQDVMDIPHDVYKYLLSRIKLISGMKLNVTKTAQDGRFSIKLEGSDIEIRSSLIPSAYGESFVMRILNPKKHPCAV